MIEINGLVKRFGSRVVLHQVDCTVASGRVTALVGANGAGKTTLIKTLLGLARPDGGSIVINGDIVTDSPAYRAVIGYMPQIARFPAHLSGRDLLGMIMALRADGVVPDLRLADDFDLGEQFDRPLGELSGGTRQKINAVLAFAFEPALLVLDEPTAGLDPLACRVLKDRIHAERARGTAVLITSHVLPELDELADDVLFLADGVVQWAGDMRSLKRTTGEPTFERAVAHLLAGRARLAVA